MEAGRLIDPRRRLLLAEAIEDAMNGLGLHAVVETLGSICGARGYGAAEGSAEEQLWQTCEGLFNDLTGRLPPEVG